MSTTLIAKHKRFADEYLKDFSATKAAVRAGYSKKTAAQIGYQLLHKTSIQAYLQKNFVKTAAKLEITKERTMTEIGRIAYSDVRKAFHADGTMKQIHELDDDTAAAISSVETEERDVINVGGRGHSKTRKSKAWIRKARLWDKTKAVEILAKHFQIFDDGGSDVVLNVKIRKPVPGNNNAKQTAGAGSKR